MYSMLAKRVALTSVHLTHFLTVIAINVLLADERCDLFPDLLVLVSQGLHQIAFVVGVDAGEPHRALLATPILGTVLDFRRGSGSRKMTITLRLATMLMTPPILC